MRRLLIISHTAHYRKSDGTIVGLSSTVTEIDHFAEIFDVITHIAMLHEGDPPEHMKPYASNRIEFVPIKPLGGKTLSSKLDIIGAIPKVLNIVRSELKRHDYFQFRAPTGIGVFLVPYLVLFSKKPGWFKYAGNWKQADAPWSFKFQRWILERQNRKVTINGNWPGQPDHCLTFDNPCLTESEIAAGKLARADASKFNDPIDFCFVGRLEDAKGVDIIIDAFNRLEPESGAAVGTIHFVGDGEKRPEYEDRAKDSGIKFKFHGWLPRQGVHDIFKRSSAILLPSASEGFPKVIPEAKNYGCVPIISKIKSLIPIISDGENGFILKDRTADQLIHVLNSFLSMTEGAKAKMVEFTDEDIVRYTYKFYNNRIMDEIIGD